MNRALVIFVSIFLVPNFQMETAIKAIDAANKPFFNPAN